MALGGGTYTSQNKVLSGAYFQFISSARASVQLSDRGVAAMALELNWGPDGKIFDVTTSDFEENSMKLLGYSDSEDEMKVLRELFCHALTIHLYKLTSGGAKASNDFAEAVYTGTRGNDLKVVIQVNVDNKDAFDVSLYMGTTLLDKQTVTAALELVDNDWVTWKKDAELAVTAGTALTGGTNGTIDTETAAHQAFLDRLESYPDTNAVGYMGTNDAVKALYEAFAERMRDKIGIRMQAVVYNHAGDSIACVNVKNGADIVPWATGVIAGTAANASATNMTYDGETAVSTDYTQKELESAIKSGEWVLHQVGDEIHVLEDVNSLVTTTDDMGEIFKDNQTIRVIDSIATSVASIFASKYLGKVPNNESGRVSLWADIVKIHQELADIDALEDFNSENITVAQGDGKKSIVVYSSITVVNTMEKLYMKTVIA